MNKTHRKINNFFEISQNNSTLSNELRAGVTTFMAMSYILLLNPQILGSAINSEFSGLTNQLMAATALTAAFGSILMGLLGRYPFALAPGMGLNAYLSYSVILGMGVHWSEAFGLVFISGIIVLLLTIFGFRSLFVKILPDDFKHAIAAGIGFFLAFIGAKTCGLIVSDQKTLVTLGNMSSPNALLCLFGLFLTIALIYKKIRGAILIGIIISSFAAVLLKLDVYQGGNQIDVPKSFFLTPAWPSDLIGALQFSNLLTLNNINIIFTLVLVCLFDTAGTLVALSKVSGWKKLNRINFAFTADAITTSMAAVFGTSSTTYYVESATGIADGGKTGLVAITVGILFLLSLFLWPLLSFVPTAATAPALMIIGSMMISNLRFIDWTNHINSFPAFLIFFFMPLSFSIANGISIGILAYLVISIICGKIRKTHPLLWLIAALIIIQYALM